MVDRELRRAAKEAGPITAGMLRIRIGELPKEEFAHRLAVLPPPRRRELLRSLNAQGFLQGTCSELLNRLLSLQTPQKEAWDHLRDAALTCDDCLVASAVEVGRLALPLDLPNRKLEAVPRLLALIDQSLARQECSAELLDVIAGIPQSGAFGATENLHYQQLGAGVCCYLGRLDAADLAVNMTPQSDNWRHLFMSHLAGARSRHPELALGTRRLHVRLLCSVGPHAPPPMTWAWKW